MSNYTNTWNWQSIDVRHVAVITDFNPVMLLLALAVVPRDEHARFVIRLRAFARGNWGCAAVIAVVGFLVLVDVVRSVTTHHCASLKVESVVA